MFQWGSHNSQFPTVISAVFLLFYVFLWFYVFLVLCFNVEDNKISCGGGMWTRLLVFHQAEQLKRLPPDPRSTQRNLFGLALKQFDAIGWGRQATVCFWLRQHDKSQFWDDLADPKLWWA